MLQRFNLKQSATDVNFKVTVAYPGPKLPGKGRFYLGYHGHQSKAISSDTIYIYTFCSATSCSGPFVALC